MCKPIPYSRRRFQKTVEPDSVKYPVWGIAGLNSQLFIKLVDGSLGVMELPEYVTHCAAMVELLSWNKCVGKWGMDVHISVRIWGLQ